MTHRYRTEVDVLREPSATAQRYHRVLTTVAGAQQDEGIFSEDVAAALNLAGTPTLEAWEAWEKHYRHETAGFVQAQRELIRGSRERSLVYLGLTSSNLQDCSDSMCWKDVCDLIERQAYEAERASYGLSTGGNRMGRTHGRDAEPVRASRVYERFTADLSDATIRMRRNSILGSLRGAVGEWNPALNSNIERQVERSLGIQMDPYPTQTSSRHAFGVAATDLYHVIGACEQLATHHRLESISGIDGFSEGFAEGEQRGSSVMPHKRNPMLSERICGLSRVARGHLQAILETANTQWWERDLTNSSVERTAFWSLASLTLYILQLTTEVLETGRIHSRFVVGSMAHYPSHELVRRVLDGEDHTTVYRDIQSRSADRA